MVRHLDRAEEGGQLQSGEVLVTTQTDIAWTPLFPRAAAIVTDVGAPLSHAAIVARELGIPAVVGCGNATMRLNTGDRVRVHGGRGTVEIYEDWGFSGRRNVTANLASSEVVSCSLLGFDPVTGEFNDSLTGDYLWSCVNVGEAMSVVITPFTWSMTQGRLE